jgi:hypothetical protein
MSPRLENTSNPGIRHGKQSGCQRRHSVEFFRPPLSHGFNLEAEENAFPEIFEEYIVSNKPKGSRSIKMSSFLIIDQ